MIRLEVLRTLAQDRFPGVKVGLAHLLVAWARSDSGDDLSRALRAAGMETAEFAAALEPIVDAAAEDDRALLVACIGAAAGEPLTGAHLLRGPCRRLDHRLTRALCAAGLDCRALEAALGAGDRDPTSLGELGIRLDPRAGAALLRYGRDLTALAAEGAFADLCSRPEDSARVVDVLSRSRKANVILTGPAGAGKTALVERLALEVFQDTRHPLAGYRIYELSIGSLVAGTRYRGDFEERLDTVVRELQHAAPAILFIDEVHLVTGAGRAEGAPMDAANLLKPFLARSDFRVIGATTHQEYHRHIARDKALARRFQEVRLSEPGAEETYRLARVQGSSLEGDHGVLLEDTMVRRAVDLTNRHLRNRHQPDKTVELLDSACVAVKRRGGTCVEIDDLLETLSRMAGTPVGTLSGEDRSSLRRLGQALKARIVGQDAAIEGVVRTLVHRRMDLGDEKRPLGVFLFAGDTGVGKTELARELAANTFPREFLLRMDEIIPFRRLADRDLRAILNLRLHEAVKRLHGKGVRLEFDEERLLDHLMALLGRDGSGARGIARLLERRLVQPLAMALLDADPNEETVVELGDDYYDEGAVSIRPARYVGAHRKRGVGTHAHASEES